MLVAKVKCNITIGFSSILAGCTPKHYNDIYHRGVTHTFLNTYTLQYILQTQIMMKKYKKSNGDLHAYFSVKITAQYTLQVHTVLHYVNICYVL